MAPASAPGLASQNCWHAAHPRHEVIFLHLPHGAQLAGAGPQLRVEPNNGHEQRDERVQAARRTAHGGTQGHTGPGLIFRYKTITYFKNPANSTKIVHNLNIIAIEALYLPLAAVLSTKIGPVFSGGSTT